MNTTFDTNTDVLEKSRLHLRDIISIGEVYIERFVPFPAFQLSIHLRFYFFAEIARLWSVSGFLMICTFPRFLMEMIGFLRLIVFSEVERETAFHCKIEKF